MKNLTKDQITAAKKFGFSIDSEAKLRKDMLAFLTKQDLEGVDDESTGDLMEMCLAFEDSIPAVAKKDSKKSSKVSIEEEEEEFDEAAEELEEEEETEEEEEIEEEEEEEGIDLESLSREELKSFIKENNLDVKVFKTDTDDALRNKIREACSDSEEEEEEIIEEKPKAKTATKQATTKATKSVEDFDEIEVEEKPKSTLAPKKAKTESKRGATVQGEKFDLRNNPKHKIHLKRFEQFFSKENFVIDILKNGFTVRFLGKNNKVTIMNYDELVITDNGLVGNLYTNRLKSIDELMERIPEELHERQIGMFRGETHPSIKKVTEDEVFECLESGVYEESMKRAGATDKKMGESREALDNKLKSVSTSSQDKKAAVTKKSAEPAPVVKKKVVLKKK